MYSVEQCWQDQYWQTLYWQDQYCQDQYWQNQYWQKQYWQDLYWQDQKELQCPLCLCVRGGSIINACQAGHQVGV